MASRSASRRRWAVFPVGPADQELDDAGPGLVAEEPLLGLVGVDQDLLPGGQGALRDSAILLQEGPLAEVARLVGRRGEGLLEGEDRVRVAVLGEELRVSGPTPVPRADHLGDRRPLAQGVGDLALLEELLPEGDPCVGVAGVELDHPLGDLEGVLRLLIEVEEVEERDQGGGRSSGAALDLGRDRHAELAMSVGDHAVGDLEGQRGGLRIPCGAQAAELGDRGLRVPGGLHRAQERADPLAIAGIGLDSASPARRRISTLERFEAGEGSPGCGLLRVPGIGEPALQTIEAQGAADIAAVGVGQGRPERLALLGRARPVDRSPDQPRRGLCVARSELGPRPLVVDGGSLSGWSGPVGGLEGGLGLFLFAGGERRSSAAERALWVPSIQGLRQAERLTVELVALRELVGPKERLALALGGALQDLDGAPNIPGGEPGVDLEVEDPVAPAPGSLSERDEELGGVSGLAPSEQRPGSEDGEADIVGRALGREADLPREGRSAHRALESAPLVAVEGLAAELLEALLQELGLAIVALDRPVVAGGEGHRGRCARGEEQRQGEDEGPSPACAPSSGLLRWRHHVMSLAGSDRRHLVRWGPQERRRTGRDDRPWQGLAVRFHSTGAPRRGRGS